MHCPPFTAWLCTTLGKSQDLLRFAVLLCRMRSLVWTSRRLAAGPQGARFPGAPSPLLPSLPLLVAELTVPSSAFPWPPLMTPEMGAFPRVPEGWQAGHRCTGWSLELPGPRLTSWGRWSVYPEKTERTGGFYPWFQPPLNPDGETEARRITRAGSRSQQVSEPPCTTLMCT